jgi:hypothetical protein
MSEIKFNIYVVSAVTFSWTYNLIKLRMLIQKWTENNRLEVQWVDHNLIQEIVL